MAVAWRLVKPRVVANTGGKIQSVWTDDGPRYGDIRPDDLDTGGQGRRHPDLSAHRSPAFAHP